MTVIAYKSGVMAADTMEQFGDDNSRPSNIKSLASRKIIRRQGWLLGVSGSLCPSNEQIAEWFFDPEHFGYDTRPRFRSAKFVLLSAAPGGKAYLWDETGMSIPSPTPWYAVGSGQEFAMGAMSAGASAKKAVSIAIKLCPTCGGKTVTRRL